MAIRSAAEEARLERAGKSIGRVMGALLVSEVTYEGEETQALLAELLRCCGWTCTPPGQQPTKRPARKRGAG